MKRNTKILLALTAITLGAALIAISRRNKVVPIDTGKIADEGYETAHDILFPHKHNRKPKDVHYGPVLPA